MSARKDDKYTANRKKLYKVLGKEATFSATKGSVSGATGKSVCLINLRYRGKVVADHIWVSNTKTLQRFEKGDHLYFKGTASTYKDKKDVRKIGLASCNGYHKKHPGIDKYLHDKKHAEARTR